MRLLACILVLVFASGCAMISKNENGRTEIKYGNYCGENRPRVPKVLLESGKEQSHANWLRGISDNYIAEMKKKGKIVPSCWSEPDNSTTCTNKQKSFFPQAPKDSIDAACQMHDVCYALSNSTSNTSGTSAACDYALHQNIININKSLQGIPQTATPEYSGNLHGVDKRFTQCIRLCEHIEMFSATRLGSAGNPSSFHDVYANLLIPIVAVAYVPSDAIFNGSALPEDKIRCIASGNTKIIAPVSIDDYKKLLNYYNGLSNKSGYEGEGLYKVESSRSGNKVKISIAPTK